jgi:hypothetical protein
MQANANVHTLTLEGSLKAKSSKTIQYAIAFTCKMGLCYLWVDAPCIIQDDQNDKAAQLSRIGAIYKCALFTIVVGAGQDAEARLPGLSSPRTKTQYEVLVKATTNGQPPIKLISTPTPRRSLWAHYAEGLPWSNRGWTLQEKIISRRVLTFTEQQLFWTCRRCN